MFPPGSDPAQANWLRLSDDSGTFNFRVVDTANPDQTLVDAPNTELRENERYFMAVVGTADPDDEFDVELVTGSTSMADIMMLRGELEAPGTIIEAARAHGDLADWLDAVEQAGLTETLSGTGPFTVLVPVAFTPDDLPEDVRNNPDALADFLKQNIIEGDYRSQELFNAGTVTTLAGTELTTDTGGFVNGMQVIDVNIPATNGVIHIINGFVTPSEETSE
jgi:uncharacterized surface protein with fasciclin (FAS1) repeats